MDISIVSGTYNRISYLKSMVASVRQSFGNVYGLRYEIVLVDGGSTDGTLEWCKSQSDIKLIEHGKLKGAIAAFNDGAYAAIGKYVILANDDIEFLGRSILVAYAYMEINSACGAGCFYQNRDGRDWHINFMQAIDPRSRKQIQMPYAQVGIFPRWLGDHVGWWCREEDYGENLEFGDYKLAGEGMGLHTYGGDNELSAKIIETGYLVSPIPGAKINDKEAGDDLRIINNIASGKDPRAVKGHHPDSWKYGQRWRRRNAKLGYRDMDGPIVKDRPMIFDPMASFDMKRDRVLYLPLFEPGWQVLKEQKKGLRDALSEVAIVYEYDYMNKPLSNDDLMVELVEICEQFQPTIVLTQLHNSDKISAKNIRQLKGFCSPKTKFANWNGDFWPEQLLDSNGLNLANSFDLMTSVNRDVVEKHQAMNINTQYWQIGWEPEGRGYEPLMYHDVVFLASGYSEKRQELGRWLSNQDFSFGLFGHGWPDGMAKGENLYNFQEACRVYRGAKIAIGDSQWPESGFVSNRIFQILAAGNCVLCHQWFRDIDKLGLIHGQNCLIWKNIDELGIILSNVLKPELSTHLVDLSKAGEQLALNKHSFQARVSELWEMLGMVDYVTEYDWR